MPGMNMLRSRTTWGTYMRASVNAIELAVLSESSVAHIRIPTTGEMNGSLFHEPFAVLVVGTDPIASLIVAAKIERSKDDRLNAIEFFANRQTAVSAGWCGCLKIPHCHFKLTRQGSHEGDAHPLRHDPGMHGKFLLLPLLCAEGEEMIKRHEKEKT